MRSRSESSSPPPPPSAPAPRVFTAEFLDRLHALDGPLTASEAEYSGPWRTEPVPGRPGAHAVVREWESLAEGDAPRAVFLHEELARLCAVALPLLGREPLFHLGAAAGEQGGPDPSGHPPGDPIGHPPGHPPGHPIVAVEGEQGPRVCGWLPLFEPEVAGVLHVLQGITRSPVALAALLESAGGDALAQVDRILGRRLGG